MGRELAVLWAGRHQRSNWEEICESYRKRIARLSPVRDLPVRARAAADDPQRLKAEGQALLAALPPSAWTFALDSRGETLTSEQFAERLSHLKKQWPHPVAFLIGSDLGLDRAVLDSARTVLSLGPLTLSHELARVVLYEQLFRALSIEAGMSYHREPL
ncbi:MAG TPA: 23S rRNA (pseudouridine(1915)-N(3))-methyltransferase RlmH [Thermoanaerobaculia bacterium]|jgi:23S rRNA (pseudouridine1915-N3)-methyltransferase|nr:23S rRNA (pseudouridine(1915)-N(3))-methyltransferase RlmH [Thermoanaerobaculia bacterium]